MAIPVARRARRAARRGPGARRGRRLDDPGAPRRPARAVRPARRRPRRGDCADEDLRRPRGRRDRAAARRRGAPPGGRASSSATRSRGARARRRSTRPRVVDACFGAADPEPVQLPDAGSLASSALLSSARDDAAAAHAALGARRRRFPSPAWSVLASVAVLALGWSGVAAAGGPAADGERAHRPARPGRGRRGAEHAARRGRVGDADASGLGEVEVADGPAHTADVRPVASLDPGAQPKAWRSTCVTRGWSRTPARAARRRDVAVDHAAMLPTAVTVPPRRGRSCWGCAGPTTAGASGTSPSRRLTGSAACGDPPGDARRGRGASGRSRRGQRRRDARMEPSTSDEKSPSTARSANAGTGTTAGRCNARASAPTTSALRSAAVDEVHRPVDLGASSRCSMARTSSVSVIHGQNCRPSPTGRRPPAARAAGAGRARHRAS